MDLSLAKLQEAVSLRQHISILERRLGSLFSGGGSSGGSSAPSASRARPSRPSRASRGSRRPMSAATRAKLAAAARRRWALRKGGTVAKAPAKKKGGGLTAAGRKKLSDAMKARWAARRRAAGRRR